MYKIKKCACCKNLLLLKNFSIDKKTKTGFKAYCKKCIKLKNHFYYINNKQFVNNKNKIWRDKNKKYIKTYHKNHYINNKEYYSIKQKERRQKNPEKFRQKEKIWRNNNKEKINKYFIKRRKNDIKFKILCNLRKIPSRIIKNNIKSQKTLELLGCNIEFFIKYIESKFQTNMSWQNYGKNGWHIDHIQPCAAFDLSKLEEQRKCFHYSNLQPLWAFDNYIKNDKLKNGIRASSFKYHNFLL